MFEAGERVRYVGGPHDRLVDGDTGTFQHPSVFPGMSEVDWDRHGPIRVRTADLEKAGDG